MGQFHDAMMSPHVEYFEEGDNGLVVGDRYVPAELLTEIFCRTDHKTLLSCQLVCKRWRTLIQSYVWRKKAAMTLDEPFPRHKQVPWDAFYLISKKRPFKRNLLKNHSGEKDWSHWQVTNEGGNGWTIESPPVGVPKLPAMKVFEDKQSCFATSYYTCTKTQVIDLVDEGLHPYVLDVLQPPIMVTEWYSARWDCSSLYECIVKLLKVEDNITTKLDEFVFHDDLDGEKQNQWLCASHVFVNYGPGLRKISFTHSGKDKLFWHGHYGSKMAGACVYVKVPPVQHSSVHQDESDTLDE